jgi:hypothetical protein
MSEPLLDWNTADVRSRRLSVSLAGDVPSGWRGTFEKTIRLLDTADWEEIKLKKAGVRVKGVTPGSEERLRHLLESAVQEANVTHSASEDEEGEDEADADDAGSSEDAEMTERFRSFASSPSSQV